MIKCHLAQCSQRTWVCCCICSHSDSLLPLAICQKCISLSPDSLSLGSCQQSLQHGLMRVHSLQGCHQIAPLRSTLSPPAQAQAHAQGMVHLWLPKAYASVMWVMTAHPVAYVLMGTSWQVVSASAPSSASRLKLLWPPLRRAMLPVLRRSVPE